MLQQLHAATYTNSPSNGWRKSLSASLFELLLLLAVSVSVSVSVSVLLALFLLSASLSVLAP